MTRGAAGYASGFQSLPDRFHRLDHVDPRRGRAVGSRLLMLCNKIFTGRVLFDLMR
ncbi:ORFL123C [Human betaherpesvirus 5]|nr:ORFL123C [Human betaherpesvirus 5]QHX40444.1 ORFL123C [Human betaherpesvirus 5]